jgi:acetyl esterase/lipase
VAEWLNTLGVAAHVLRYRLGPRYHHPCQVSDANRAVRMVRAQAGGNGLDPKRVGVLGFSAGGHLASTAGTHFDAGIPDAAGPVDRQSCRPDLMVLIYPVISFLEYVHEGTRRNLLGDAPDPKLLELLSNDRQVTAETPPAFLVHTCADTGVPCENSLLFTMAMRRAKVPVECHLYVPGEHGFGLGGNDPVLSTWPKLCGLWLAALGFAG